MAKEGTVSMSRESIIREAKNEINKEILEELKGKYKSKLRELQRAKQIVANVEREIELIEAEMDDLETVG